MRCGFDALESMKPLPSSDNPLVVRTDFASNEVWTTIREAITAPVGEDGFLANVHFVDDRAYEGAEKDGLLPLLVAVQPAHSFAIIADRVAMTAPDHPLLVVDLFDAPGREFRAIPTAVQSIENNLSLANMDFEDFAGSVGADGVFRDFE